MVEKTYDSDSKIKLSLQKPDQSLRVDTAEGESSKSRLERGLAPWSSISFSCGGWLQLYLFGVARALQAKGLDRETHYLGCSAGALTAAGLCVGGNFDGAVKFCKEECITEAYSSMGGLFKLNEYVANSCDTNICPLFDNYVNKVHGELSVAITKLPFFRNERISTFFSADDMKRCLVASCACFPFAPFAKFRGSTYMDGGISDFQPVVDKTTITVSPLWFSNCDIKPSRYIPIWWTFLPPRSFDSVDWVYNLGFEDAMRYFDKVGIPQNSPRSRPDLMTPVARKKHPFDDRRQINMNRFLGYEIPVAGFGFGLLKIFMFFVDIFLLLQLIVIWRPLALILIYIELIVYLCVTFIVDLVKGFWYSGVDALISAWENVKTFVVHVVTLRFLKMKKDFVSYSERTAETTRSKINKFKNTCDIMSCLSCSALLLSILSVRPSAQTIGVHEELKKISAFYRFFSFII